MPKGALRKAIFVSCALMSFAAPRTLRADASAAATGTLYVTAKGFKGVQGQALVAVYSEKSSWLKVERALRIAKLKITGPVLTASFDDLPPGTYAVSVIHDANMNGKMDMHWFPIPGPDEGAGVSNDAKASLGPPSFDDARFLLGTQHAVITIDIRY